MVNGSESQIKQALLNVIKNSGEGPDRDGWREVDRDQQRGGPSPDYRRRQRPSARRTYCICLSRFLPPAKPSSTEPVSGCRSPRALSSPMAARSWSSRLRGKEQFLPCSCLSGRKVNNKETGMSQAAILIVDDEELIQEYPPLWTCWIGACSTYASGEEARTCWQGIRPDHYRPDHGGARWHGPHGQTC